MGLIKEPLDVDFVVEPRMLTTVEKEQISAYIKQRKANADAPKKKAIRKRTLAKSAKKIMS